LINGEEKGGDAATIMGMRGAGGAFAVNRLDMVGAFG
jgi:hypothetical protein